MDFGRPARLTVRGGEALRTHLRILFLCLAAALAAVSSHAVPPHPQIATSKAWLDFDLAAAVAAGLDAPATPGRRLPHRVLVLLVEFADQRQGLPAAAIDSLVFAAGPASVRSYWRDASRDGLRIGGRVSPWLRLPQTLAFYADAARDGRGVRGAYPRNARRMVEDAIRAADPHIDFRQFDDDGPDGVPSSGDDDGVVDALLVVHAGDGSEIGTPGTILSHSWTTQSPVATQDGILAYRYATIAETSPLGVAAHEFGHLLGLPDAYDRLSTTRFGGGLGDWSLMATGAWLDGGHTPGDLDGASKIELGFIVPQTPARNGTIAIRAGDATAAPDIVRVWTHGATDLEYFVLENRQRRGRDAFLPGSGLLVYHVDRRQAHNDDLDRPRIALLQADGLAHIDRRINNGDAEDPLPGRTTVFAADTNPSTRGRDGHDTRVRIRALTPPFVSMDVDVQVETTPRVRVAGLSLADAGGGAWPLPGASLTLELVLHNDGLETGALVVRARTNPQGDAAWPVGEVMLADVASDDSVRVAFALQPRAGLPVPYGLQFAIDFEAAGGWRDSTTTVAVLGADAGFQACLEPPPSRLTNGCSDPARPWSVESAGGAGTWRLETRAGDATHVWRSAGGPRYANRSDIALVSPPFRLQAGSELRLLHAADTQDEGAGYCADGGRVEIAVGPGPWEPLVPDGGYPRRFWPESVPQLAHEGAFGGRLVQRWDRFDLGTRAGIARLRLRFASDDSIAASGWEIARVEVVASSSGGTAFEPRVELVAEPNPLRFPARIAFRITAPLTFGARPTTLDVFDVRGRRIATIEHAPVPAQTGFVVWDGTDRAGRPVPAGVYFARLDWGGVRATHRLVVVR